MSKYTQADLAFLDGLRDTSAFELARMAGCESPDSTTSPGAEYLGEIRDAVVERWEAGRFDWDSSNGDGDLISECEQEGIIPDGYHETALLFVDLGAYMQGCETTMHGVWTGTIDEIMRDAITQIGYACAVACIEEARRDFASGFVCSQCGDAGEPHLCFPGDCRGSDEERAEYAAQADGHAQAILTGSVPLDSLDVQRTLQRAPEPAESASVTQAFMRNMEAINREEFGTPMSGARRITLYALGALAMLGIIAVAMVVWG